MFNLPITPEFADSLDWELQPPGMVTLLPEQMQQAAHWSQPIPDPEQQWQVYLNGLALLGCEQWLQQRAPELAIADEQCSIRQPIYASLINAVSHLQVGEFKICVLAIGSLTDTQFSLPRAVLDLPEFAAHWYVWVEVLEESEQVQVYGCLSYDSLIQQADSLPIELDWHYTLPLQLMEPDALLLGLRCLDPNSVALPIAQTAPRSQANAILQKKVAAVLPQLRSQKRTLWQVLTWDEAATLFSSPDLMNWLSSELMPQPSVARTAVNAACWLRDQLDSTAQALSLMLMPSMMSAFRSGRGLDSVRADLAAGGIEIPASARGTYQDLQWENLDLRLYTIIWTVPATSRLANEEWALLLVLGGQPGARPPFGVKLEVSDLTEVLVEEVLEERSNNSYLYAQVIGEWNEKFQITLSFNQSIITTLVYEFQPDLV